MQHAEGMALAEVLAVLRAIRTTGSRYWLEGGWGVDALVGHQTRPHRDVDVDFDHVHEAAMLDVLAGLGYEIEVDWRPNRVELVAAGRGRVDLHPLAIGPDGGARQAALDGGWHVFPRDWSATGSLDGVVVPCVSAHSQRLFRSGYELRDVDRHDLALLDRLGR